jgi:hypothetical protein
MKFLSFSTLMTSNKYTWLVALIVLSLNSSNSLCQSIDDINHIIHIGQSLGAGEHSLPIVTDSSTGFNNFSFKMGIHTWNRFDGAHPELRDSTYFTFIPLTAHERGHEGETIANGLCDHLKSTSKSFFDKDFSFLFSFSGQGGRLLRELDKIHDHSADPRAAERQSVGGYYKTIIDDVKRAQSMAKSKKLDYSVFAITWMQGEAHAYGHINRWDKPIQQRDQFLNIYKSDLIQYKNDLDSDISKITGIEKRIPFFTYQTIGATTGTAQLMACDEDEDMYMVGPTYMIPNGENSRLWNTQEHGNDIHLTADGERWLGEMFGKVIRKVVFEKVDWNPLRPEKAWLTRNKKRIRVEFHVPTAPLVLDTTFLPKQGSSFGFEVYDSTNRYNVVGVTVVRKNMIEIKLSESLRVNSRYLLRYGMNSFVADVSKKILKVHPNDSIINGVPHVKIEFESDITEEFRIIANEGVFSLANRSKNQDELTVALIRNVYLNTQGNTTLLLEKDDFLNGIPMKSGQSCYMTRRFPYGNLRDSDNEESTFRFKDSTYGTRYGQRYPLFNWSIVFQDMAIKGSRK